MKALRCGVLCAGLFGQALVYADVVGQDALAPTSDLGHASIGWQQDDADGDSTALALALPVGAGWYLNGSQARSENTIDSSGGSETLTATSRRFGLSLEQPDWSGSLSLLRYDDDAVLATDETQLMLRLRGKRWDVGFELASRAHEVFADLPAPFRDREESFDSRGVGLHLGYSTAGNARLFGGWQQYRYDDARVLDPDFGGRLLDYPRLYQTLIGLRDQADGALVDHNAWLGADLPIAEHLLTVEHAISELEVDGTEFSSDTIILALNLSEHFGLDVSVGSSRGDQTDTIRFAGVTLHLFW